MLNYSITRVQRFFNIALFKFSNDFLDSSFLLFQYTLPYGSEIEITIIGVSTTVWGVFSCSIGYDSAFMKLDEMLYTSKYISQTPEVRGLIQIKLVEKQT